MRQKLSQRPVLHGGSGQHVGPSIRLGQTAIDEFGTERDTIRMLRLKGCERCGGDVSVDRDWHGEYINCLQCGWYKDTSGDPLEGMVETAMTTLRAQMAGEAAIPTLRERLAREKAS